MEVKKKMVNIPCSLENMYKHYLTILKPINKLRTREIELLAHIMFLYKEDEKNILKPEDRWRKVFSYEGKVS